MKGFDEAGRLSGKSCAVRKSLTANLTSARFQPNGGGTDVVLTSEKWSSRRRVAGKYCVICERRGKEGVERAVHRSG